MAKIPQKYRLRSFLLFRKSYTERSFRKTVGFFVQRVSRMGFDLYERNIYRGSVLPNKFNIRNGDERLRLPFSVVPFFDTFVIMVDGQFSERMLRRVFDRGHGREKFPRHVARGHRFGFFGFSVQSYPSLCRVDNNASEAVTSAFRVKTSVNKRDKFVFGTDGNAVLSVRNYRRGRAFPVPEEGERLLFGLKRLVFRSGKAVHGASAIFP